MSTVTQPRAGIAIGTVNVGGQLMPVELHPEYTRFFESLQRRLGVNGSSSVDLERMATERPQADPRVDDASRAIDELRNELASLRTSCDRLRSVLDEQAALLESIPRADSLRARVETIEGRLA